MLCAAMTVTKISCSYVHACSFRKDEKLQLNILTRTWVSFLSFQENDTENFQVKVDNDCKLYLGGPSQEGPQ